METHRRQFLSACAAAVLACRSPRVPGGNNAYERSTADIPDGIGSVTVAGGHTPDPDHALPSWAPPPGFFNDVPAANNARDVIPSFYARRKAIDVFNQWTGSAYATRFSAKGAMSYFGSGHLSRGDTLFQPVLSFNFDDLAWYSTNEPVVPNHEGDPTDPSGMFADGTWYPPHTYLGLQYLPPAWGGKKPRGELLSFFHAGARIENRVLRLDLNKKRNGWGKFVTIDFESGIKGSYPSTAMDFRRQGWWVGTCYGTTAKMAFLDPLGNIAYFGKLAYNRSTCWAINPDADVMVGLHDFNKTPDSTWSVYVVALAHPENGIKNVRVEVAPGTAIPYHVAGANPHYEPFKMGLSWSKALKCYVGYEGRGSTQVHRLIPPADPLNGVYRLESEQMQPHGATNPVPVNNGTANGTWAKFMEIPHLRCFFWADRHDAKPQVFRLKGM